MLRSLFLLLVASEGTVQFSTYLPTTAWPQTTTPSVTQEVAMGNVRMTATAGYPVAVGQSVHLHCTADRVPPNVTWTWLHHKNQEWQEVHTGSDLSLTEPKQSGLYKCHAKTVVQEKTSSAFLVYIFSTQATVGENLGIAAFVFSLLALIINIAVISWLCCQRSGGTSTISNAGPKCFPGPEKSPKGGLPQADCDGDVYMNYTSTNPAYTDLDPSSMTGDNVYSSLS